MSEVTKADISGGRGWVAKDIERWKAGCSEDFYNSMSDCRRLLLTKDELTFLEKQTAPDRGAEVFINMNCGTQLIPHVTLKIVDVFRALSIKIVAGIGVQFCCGKPFRTDNQERAEERISQTSLNRFLDLGAKTAVHACQSCGIAYENFTAEREEATPGLTNQHLTWFMENQVRERADRVPWKREPGIRALVDECHAITPVHRASHDSVARLLALIPGVEVVGSIDTTSRGAPCATLYPGGPRILAKLSDDEQTEVRHHLEETARGQHGADVIVMTKHWCQREWRKFSSNGLSARHFMSLVAEALGSQHQDRYGEYWKLHDPERVVDLSRACWTSWGIDQEAAQRIAYMHFDPHFSGFANAECACGGDSAKCNTGKFTLAQSITDNDTGALGRPIREQAAMSTEANVTPDEPTVADFTYPDFYRAMVEREHMQVAKDEATWCEQPKKSARPVDVLLNFGCNVRQTPHLQREAVAVLETLGVDFEAVAGQQFCCGKPYSNNGLDDVAKSVVKGSVGRMAAYQPKRALQWCSACEMQFRDLVVPQVGIEFRSDGLAAFLVERLDKLGDAVPWVSDVQIKVLVHGHLGEHAVRDSHPPIAMQLLQRIPGVAVVGLAESAVFSLCDNAGPKIANITTDEYRSAQAELELYLADSGADTLVTLYHGCTRELGKFASDRFSARHYVSVLAQALGVSKPDRFSEYWRLGDPVRVMEASRANWESWGISEEEALRLAHKHFVPSYASNVPDCPCHGECTRTGAVWLLPHEVGQQRAVRWRA